VPTLAFGEANCYPKPNTPDETFLNEIFFRGVIVEPKPTKISEISLSVEKKPTRDGHC
jgi:hypothetical protein